MIDKGRHHQYRLRDGDYCAHNWGVRGTDGGRAWRCAHRQRAHRCCRTYWCGVHARTLVEIDARVSIGVRPPSRSASKARLKRPTREPASALRANRGSWSARQCLIVTPHWGYVPITQNETETPLFVQGMMGRIDCTLCATGDACKKAANARERVRMACTGSVAE